jgi:cephalosporin hydroxylase
VEPREKFQADVASNIAKMSQDHDLQALSRIWSLLGAPYNYSYNFSWLGVPIIQLPPDVVAMQELIWQIKPTLIIETGIAWGGSLVMSASMLTLLDYCDALSSGRLLDPARPSRRVLGVDIDIRPHNRTAIAAHPMASRIEMIEGSSIAQDVVASVRERARGADRVLVALDSNHTHEHVLAELHAYAPLVTPGSYCVVFDTLIEDRSPGFFADRPWDKGNNPKTAVWEFLRQLETGRFAAADGAPLKFEIDKRMEHKLLITVAPDGYLKRV